MLHDWVDGPEAVRDCLHCHINSWDHPQVATCEEWLAIVEERRAIAERRHLPTEAAWEKARRVLTVDEWKWLKMSRPYRERDIIRVGDHHG